MVIASYARANEWAGVTAGLRHRTRMAVVSSTTTWHQSSRVATTVRSPFLQSERLDAYRTPSRRQTSRPTLTTVRSGNAAMGGRDAA